jgi:hypothetical protein
MRSFFAIVVIGILFFGIYGCADEPQPEPTPVVTDETAQEADQEANQDGTPEDEQPPEQRLKEDIGRIVEQGIRKAERQLGKTRERIERSIEDSTLTDEELERITREVEESVATGLSRVGRIVEEIGTRIREDANVEVIDFRAFQDLLPISLMDMERIDWSGENKTALGMRFSKLEARYEGPISDMEIAILDLGTMKGLASMGFDFIDQNIDEASQDGFKRTREYHGWPGLESVEYHSDHTDIQGVVVIGERIVVAVNAKGERLKKDFLSTLFSDLDFGTLEQMIP